MPNKLADQTSPYLLQHAENPVDWHPWSAEALSRARTEQKPIFLSIGYAACHWCHVMAHESFEDPAIAEIMNAYFINIKVDREERPDLDDIYMSATVALTGSGGWPMSVFLTPDLQPFYAGTYFPPSPRYNMPSFRDLLMVIANAWEKEREKIFTLGTQALEQMRSSDIRVGTSPAAINHSLLDGAAELLWESYDWASGGWGQAPKFPNPLAIEFLIHRGTQAGQPENRGKYLQLISHLLKKMSRGGIYDVIGGGFSRYSTDKEWLVPHFEKMLYDNAQLSRAYLIAYLVTGNTRFRQVCEKTLDFMQRELTGPEGGFFSSLDADSEGEEGKFYVWRYDELQTVLAEDFSFFKKAYDLRPEGNWEGKIILQRAPDEQELADAFQLFPEEAVARLSSCHDRLFETRKKRIRPSTDDKIITAWNGLALCAFAEAGRYLRRQDYLDTAMKNADFLLENLYQEGLLLRSWRKGQPRHNACLEDYAALIVGLITLYQSDPDSRWYRAALKLGDEMVAHFYDAQNGFYDTRDDQEMLPLRPRNLQDNVTPSGSALAVNALLLSAAYGDRPQWRTLAEESLFSLLGTAVKYPGSFAKWLSAADFSLGPVREVAIIGDSPALVDALWQTYRPRLVAAISPFPPPDSPALLAGRPLQDGRAAAYLCRDFVCEKPATTPQELAAQLDIV